MKIMVWLECLVEIVRSQAQKCTGADTFLFGNQTVPLKYSQTVVCWSLRQSDQLMEEKSVILGKHKEPKPLTMQKVTLWDYAKDIWLI